jgi:uncharacterized membrane protein YphA (DoxX/SURF4 family)
LKKLLLGLAAMLLAFMMAGFTVPTAASAHAMSLTSATQVSMGGQSQNTPRMAMMAMPGQQGNKEFRQGPYHGPQCGMG